MKLFLPALILALLLAAAGCLIAGVSVLAGPGWALVSAAGSFALLALVAARGMIHLG